MTIEELYNNALNLLQQLISIPSFSKEENLTADVIINYLESKNIATKRLMNNVWSANKYFDESKPTILLNSHHDTVKPNRQYSKNPYDAIIDNDKLYGLGSNDAGGCLVALMTVFIHYYNHQQLKYNLLFAATAEEEISGANGVELLLPQLPLIDFAIVGEPTLMNMAVTEKGLLVLDCIAKGKAGHAARNEGENAIYKAIKDIEWINNFKYDKVSELLGANKMSVTIINAGTQHNMVPHECRFTIDVRVNELYTHEEIVKLIQENIESEIQPRSIRLRSTNIDLEHPLIISGIKEGRIYYGSPTTSDKALMNFPALKIGPGDSARSHTADEFIFLDEIKEGIKLYIRILNNVIL